MPRNTPERPKSKQAGSGPRSRETGPQRDPVLEFMVEHIPMPLETVPAGPIQAEQQAMAAAPVKEFCGVVEPSKTPPTLIEKIDFSLIIKDAFCLRTLCLFGAVAQIGFSAIVPRPWNALPAVVLGLHSLVTTLLQCTFFRRTNAFVRRIVPGRSTAQLPNPETGRYGTLPAAQPLVVFHFGVRFNHALGVLAPGARETTSHFQAMVRSLNEDRQASSAEHDSQYGLLGASCFRGCDDRTSHNTLLYVLYFSSLEGLQRFANSPVHRNGWKYLRDCGHSHISAFHETFIVPAGAYETVYINSAPTLLGKAVCPCPDGLYEEDTSSQQSSVWVSSLVDAAAAPLRTMSARLRNLST